MRRSTALVLGSALLWGTTFPATRWGLVDLGLPPAPFLFWRFVAATGLLAAIGLGRGGVRWEYFGEWRLWLFGAINALGYLLQFEGQSITTASKTSLLVNVNVLVTAVCAWYFLGEAIGRGVWAGLILGTVGVTLLTTNGVFTVLGDEFAGDAMAFGTGICWTVVILGYKSFLTRHPGADPIGMNLVVFSVGVLSFAVASLAGPGLDLPVHRESVGLVLYLGFFATTLAFLAWQVGLSDLGASVSSILLLFEALVALILSFLFLQEKLTGWSAIGAALVLAAMYLASRAPPSTSPPMPVATGRP